MEEFYNEPVVAIRRVAPDEKGIDMWEISTPKGEPMAYMAVSQLSLFMKVLKAINLVASMPLKVQVTNQRDQVMLRIHRIFSHRECDALMTGRDGKIVGRLRQIKTQGAMVKGNNDYQIFTEDGILVGSLKGNWKSNVMTMSDDKNNIIGKIDRTEPNLPPNLFVPGVNRYHVVHVYFPPVDKMKRLMVMAVAAAIDAIIY
jgi:hypothetical protein